jgi:hypothetical protein
MDKCSPVYIDMSMTRKNRKSPARIIVYHCKSKNFGDGINPLIFNHFFKDTNVKPIYKDIETLPFHSERRDPCILGVGSILSWNSKKDASNQIICGSGFIDKNKIPQKPRKIISIRGIKTRKKFLDAKIQAPVIYGDLALLLKFIIPPPKQIEKKYGARIERAELDVYALAAPPPIAEHLKLKTSDPCLVIIRRYFDDQDKLFEITITYHPEKKYVYSMEFRASTEV